MRIIPAIDIIDGKCVRLSQGDYAQMKIYNEDPLEVAKSFEDSGLKYLHLVDLDGAKAKHIVNWKVLNKIATNTELLIDFGGGIKTDEDIKVAFESGASKVTGGTVAAKNEPVFLDWLNKFGPQKIILGADAKNGKIATNGWQESTELTVIHFINHFSELGIQYVICTDIAKDGMMNGPALELYKSILTANPAVKLIASGGVSNPDDIHKLAELNLEGVIIGKAIYEGAITLKQLREFC